VLQRTTLVIFNLLLFIGTQSGWAQGSNGKTQSTLLDSILGNNSALQPVIEKKDKFRTQIIYSRISKDPKDEIVLTHYSFNVNEKSYFYPASLVKLPLSIFAIEKMNGLKSMGVSLESKLSIDSNYTCQKAITEDLLSNDLKPSIKNYITKALVVSDNESYNRLFEFVNPGYCEQRLSELGFNNARIISRFSSCDSTENRHTNSFKFYNDSNELIYSQPPAFFSKKITPPFANMKIGKAHYAKGKTINTPKDFSKSNCFPLQDMHDLLISLVYPETSKLTFSLSADDRNFLLKCLSSSPQESEIIPIVTNPAYNEFMTNYLYYGAQKNVFRNPNLKVYNIVGQSYGFISDISYFQDTQNNVEFFLSAVIYTNSSEVVGNGGYQYETVGFPFLQELGKTIYKFELNDKKEIESKAN
jgi:hypothetical protein